MTLAIDHDARCEAFTAHGRRYVWHEGRGAQHPSALRLAGHRPALEAMFSRTVLPGILRRGATHRVQGAGPRGGYGQAWWGVWHAPGDRQPVWALYTPTRRLGDRHHWVQGPIDHRPANDGALLVAWGDGPVLVWASDRPGARAVLREALRGLPDFLGGGLASADATLPLRITAG
jgi:hypothetical protein